MVRPVIRRKPLPGILKETEFFAALSAFPNITNACQIARISPSYVYQQRKENPEFREKFEECMALGVQAVEDMALQRAFKGYEKGIYYQGNKVATEYEPSDRLAEFVLKAHKPEKYRENATTFNIGANSLVAVLSGMPRSDVLEQSEELKQLEAKVIDGTTEARPASPD